MTKKVDLTGIPQKAETMADDFVLNNLVGNKKPLENVHNFLRTHEKYRAKVSKFKQANGIRKFLYEFADQSLIEIEEDTVTDSRSYTIPKKV